MGQEIRTQIEGMQEISSKPLHFTFEETINNTFDEIYNQGNVCHEQQEEVQSERRRSTPCKNNIAAPTIQTTSKQATISVALQRRIETLEESLVEKETELKAQHEKASKDLKYCGQQYKEKIQVDRLHFENLQRFLKHAHNDEMKKAKKEIAQVKCDARLVIEFVRRKANEAIDEETSKMEHQKKSIGRKMEALESEMKRTFHNHLLSLEEEVKMVVKKEKNKAVDLNILPPPPPRNISILQKRNLNSSPSRPCLDTSIPSDKSEAPDLWSDDSISTCNSDEILSVIKEKKNGHISNEHELLRTRGVDRYINISSANWSQNQRS